MKEIRLKKGQTWKTDRGGKNPCDLATF